MNEIRFKNITLKLNNELKTLLGMPSVRQSPLLKLLLLKF